MSSGEDLRFDNRVAIVTGAGRGLGRAYALALATRGAAVVVNDLGSSVAGEGADSAPARSVVAEIEAAGGRAIANGADVADEEAAGALVAEALDRFGRVDIVVNNAGNVIPQGLPELRSENLDSHFSVHVDGALNVTRPAWLAMVEQGYGRIVMTSSVSLFGAPTTVGYSTAKGGVFSFGRSLAQGATRHGIRVNMLAPAADTRMIDDPSVRANHNIAPREESTREDHVRGPGSATAMMLVLAHERCPCNGETLVGGLGRLARVFAAETVGLFEPGFGPEDVLEHWDEIVDDAEYTVHGSTGEAIAHRERILGRAEEG